MGTSVEQWRMRIGLFGSRRCWKHGASVSNSSLGNLLSAVLAAVVIFMLLVIGNVEINPGPFPCKLCSTVPESISSSLNHQQFHSKDKNFKFYCPSPECNLISSSFGTIRTHVSFFHNRTKHRSFSSPAADGPLDHCFRCEVTSCNFSAPVLWELVQHLYIHLNQGVQIPQCPLATVCEFKHPFKKKSTFQSHLGQYHKDWNPSGRRGRWKSNQVNEPLANTSGNLGNPFEQCGIEDLNSDVPDVGPSNFASQEDLEDPSFLDDDLVTEYIAKFYLQLYGAYFLPYDMIQEISNSLQFITEVIHARTKRTLTTELKRINVPDEEIKLISFKVMHSDLLYATHHKNAPGTSFTSDYLRKKYFMQNLGYIPPVEVSLDNNNLKSDKKYQYVPINQTLETLLRDPTVEKEIDESFILQPSSNDQMLSNYTDGSLFKSEQHPIKEIHLILYQDGYNPVMNVLGSAKNKFKALAMYFTIGNLKPILRSKIASKHLVMIIRESVMKDLGPKKCFQKLIEDLKKLELNGITFKGEVVKVVVELFLGDNLGQHFIGGFIGSFSSTYFCRFCIIKKKDFKDNPAKTNPLLTRQKYNQCVLKANLTGNIVQGIKENSPFNSLQYLHSSTSLAPCLAHDLFEGVVSWDLSAVISLLVKDKWFSYEFLNRRIKYFRCKGTDLPNKPAFVRSKGDKLGGHAVQNWTFLRLLPFILGKKIKNIEHEAWKLYLQLKELCELLCQPKFNKTDAAYLKDVLLPAYFERRALVIKDSERNPLRPKHHYMSHYPELFLRYGPLIHLWSLPYEQMHKMFKTICRLSRNFINVEYTCAVRHQMHLAYLGTGLLFPDEKSEAGSKMFLRMSYSGPLLAFLQTQDFEPTWSECKTLHVNGLTYKQNDLLLISSRPNGSILTGFIKIILSQPNREQFILETFVAKFHSELGVYQLPHERGQFLLLSRGSLSYPVPQPVYNLRGIQSFSLKTKLI